jgi:O-antigen/teichoic acid export membrane protein
MVVIGLTYLAVLWVLKDVLVEDVLRLPADLQAEGRYVLVGTAMVASIEAFFVPFQAALDGLGRMDLSSAIDATQRVLSSLGVILVLALGWGLAGLVWKNALMAVLAGLAYRSALGRLAPELADVPIRVDRREVGRLVTFGRHVQTVNASTLALETAAKVVIGRGPGLAAVATFELAWRVVAQGGGALLGAATAVFPAAAERHAGDREAPATRAALLSLYAEATRYLSWATLPFYLILAALAGPFVQAWLGPGREEVATAMVVLVAGFLVGVLAGPAHMVAQATGRERVSSTAAILTVVTAAAAMVPLVPRHGLMGAVVGVGLGVAVGGIVAWLLFARTFGTGWSTVTCMGGRGTAAAAAGAIVSWGLGHVVSPTLVGVGLASLAGLATFAVLLAASGALGRRERELLLSIVGAAAAGRTSGPPPLDSSEA